MNNYKIENIVIKAGVFTDAQDLIPKKVQPLLDMGSKKVGSSILLLQLYLQKESTFA